MRVANRICSVFASFIDLFHLLFKGSSFWDGMGGVWRSVTEYYENSGKYFTGGLGWGVSKIGQISVT